MRSCRAGGWWVSQRERRSYSSAYIEGVSGKLSGNQTSYLTQRRWPGPAAAEGELGLGPRPPMYQRYSPRLQRPFRFTKWGPGPNVGLRGRKRPRNEPRPGVRFRQKLTPIQSSPARALRSAASLLEPTDARRRWSPPKWGSTTHIHAVINRAVAKGHVQTFDPWLLSKSSFSLLAALALTFLAARI
jgi:hypothetical protein